MTALFARIRWRMVGWTVLVLGLILILVGLATYVILARSLVDQADRSLSSQGEQVEERLRASGGKDFQLDRDGFRGGFFYLLATPAGQIVANPQKVNPTTLGGYLAAIRDPSFTTLTFDGDPVRLYARPLDVRSPNSLVLVVGQSLVPENEALQRVVQVLLVVGGGGLILTIGGAWFLAGRALVPVQIAFRRQQEFVADASHELRTPLTVLQSAHDLLAQHRSEPLEKNGALLDDIRAEIGRMERLTDDLLTLARSDQGTLYLEVADVDLGAIAVDVANFVSPLARERGVSITLLNGCPLPLIEGDPDRLRQVLLILVDNALKHTPAGGVVTISSKADGAGVQVQVADSGEGIDPIHLPRLFDRFYRVDKSRSREVGGTGLGLAIAKSVVEAHDGHLTIASDIGVGTTATIHLSALPPPPSLVKRFQQFAGRVLVGRSG